MLPTSAGAVAVAGPLLHFIEGLQWPRNRILWERSQQKHTLGGPTIVTIALALASPTGIIVGTDTRVIESDGTLRAPFAKTFHLLGGTVLGAHAGLVDFDGLSIPDHLADIALKLRDIKGLGVLADELAAALAARLRTNTLLNRESRRIEVLLASTTHAGSAKRSGILAIEIRHGSQLKRLVHTTRRYSRWAAIGDDSSKGVVADLLSREFSTSLHLDALESLAHRALEAGIAAAGFHPLFPGVISCSLPVSVLKSPVRAA